MQTLKKYISYFGKKVVSLFFEGETGQCCTMLTLSTTKYFITQSVGEIAWFVQDGYLFPSLCRGEYQGKWEREYFSWEELLEKEN